MSTLRETTALTFRKYVSEPGMKRFKYTEILFFWFLLLCFCFRKIASNMLNFQGLLPRKKPLVATFNETSALTFRN